MKCIVRSLHFVLTVALLFVSAAEHMQDTEKRRLTNGMMPLRTWGQDYTGSRI